MPFCFLVVTGCADGKLPFPLDEDTPLPPLSAEERCEAQRELANFKIGQRLPGMVGGVLFDGIVNDVRAAADGKLVVLLRVENRLFGTDLMRSDALTIISPAADRGGVAFELGRRYRVFAVPQRGNFYTWGATGTFDLDRPIDCPK
jgi:hypothetical protein